MSKPFSLSVKIVIRNNEGRCLVIRRSGASKFNAGKWDFPGGKVDAGETFDAALIREVQEETGLCIQLERVAGCAEAELPDRKVAYIIMEGKYWSGCVKLSSEHDEYRWLNQVELLQADVASQFIAFVEDYVSMEGLANGSQSSAK